MASSYVRCSAVSLNYLTLCLLCLWNNSALGASEVTISRTITNTFDDVEEETDGYLLYDSSDIELAYDYLRPSTFALVIGLRFNRLNIPQGCRISSAFIEFQCDEEATTVSPIITIWGEDVDHSQRPQRQDSFAISTRAKTSASVLWDDFEVWELGVKYNSPELRTIVQEIVDRTGWRANNSIMFMLEGDSSNKTRIAEASDGAGGPKLVVMYELTEMPESTPSPTTDQENGQVSEANIVLILAGVCGGGAVFLIAVLTLYRTRNSWFWKHNRYEIDHYTNSEVETNRMPGSSHHGSVGSDKRRPPSGLPSPQLPSDRLLDSNRSTLSSTMPSFLSRTFYRSLMRQMSDNNISERLGNSDKSLRTNRVSDPDI
mmetsp:Transcript_12787/g.14752  ORF Transcript_12787/g.14752 Transcript_12787/m.14752 type:complete len:373 (+) Transcript_12787:64-1182(+)